jgi:hypothetical protein
MSQISRRAQEGFALATAVATVMAVFALGSASAAARAHLPIAVGVNLDNAPGLARPMDRYVKLVHRRPALVMWYQQWSEPLFYRLQLPHVQALGAAPLVTWDPSLNGVGVPFPQIVSGRYDAYLRAAAREAAAWGLPIYIRFAHEMNLRGSPFGPGHAGDTASQFVRAWRHVVRVFRQERATNVEWVWSPNVDCDGKCPFKAFYPGNSWVDWVALDGYNYASVSHVPWMSFSRVFGASYRELTKLSPKPVMIAETSTASRGGSKPAWIRQTFRTIPSRYPRIRAVVWFDRVKETNWTVNSSPAALRAWRHVVSSSRYAGSAATLLRVAPLARDIVTEAARRSPAGHPAAAPRRLGSSHS